MKVGSLAPAATALYALPGAYGIRPAFAIDFCIARTATEFNRRAERAVLYPLGMALLIVAKRERRCSQGRSRRDQTDPTRKRMSSFQSPINFVRIAYRTNSAVDETLSLRIADARWVSTVFTLRFKTAPTDLLVCPSAIS